ncbi:hypothetical protein ACHAW6_001219, partial [Cyclotella cf. meneghiniana]
YQVQTIFLTNHIGYFTKALSVQVFTKLDVILQYYTFELDEESQDHFTIITPFGKYNYTRRLMGLKCSPDIAQFIMESVSSDINDANVYIENVGAFSKDWDHHVQLLTINLHCLSAKESNWLGYWLAVQGLKPWKKKIEAILPINHRCNATELRMFIGCLNYYHEIWPSCAHILKPLADHSSLKKHLLYYGQMKCNMDVTKCMH